MNFHSILSGSSAARFAFWFKICFSALLCACLLGFVVDSRHWPLVGDAPLIHYVVFLMHHGMVPYRDIKDINLPGTYAVEAAVMAVFGGGSQSWRLWDFTLVASIGVLFFDICRPVSRFAAFFAFSLFALIHGRDGLIELGQRDLLLTVFVLASYACLFRIARRPQCEYLPTCMSGLWLGAAVTVKPLAAVLVPFVIVWIAWVTVRTARKPLRHILAFAGSALVPGACCLIYLALVGATDAFFQVTRDLLPLHAAVLREPLQQLVLHSVSSVVLPMFAVWVALSIRYRIQRKSGIRNQESGIRNQESGIRNQESGIRNREERVALLAGFLFGVLSFCAQGRGYSYHRYPSEAFLLLLMALDFTAALQAKNIPAKALAVAGLGFGVLILAPRSVAAAAGYDWKLDGFDTMLEADLHRVPRRSLDGEVQCVDMAGGCIATLYRMRLVQSTGYLYDCYVFIPPQTALARAKQAIYRREFLAAFERAQPAYVIVTSDECGIVPPDFSYQKLDAWPEFAHLLQSGYAIVSSPIPTVKEGWEGRPVLPYGYRLYRRNGHGS